MTDGLAAETTPAGSNRNAPSRDLGSPAPRPRRGLRFAAPTILGLATVWMLAAWWWPTLPALIPLHFDAAGLPTRWGPANVVNWFLIPFIATWALGLVAGISLALPALARHHPEFVNLPGRLKRIWIGLPAETRIRTLAPLQWLLSAVGVGTSVLFVAVLWQTLAIAIEVASSPEGAPTPQLRSGSILLFAGLVVVAAILATLRVRGLVLREAGGSGPAERARTDEGPRFGTS